jgi:poly(A) polymerase
MHEVPTDQLLQCLPDRRLISQLNSFACARGVSLYLVGGCVRDLLLKRPVNDLDFALEGDTLSFVRDFADILGAAFVTLEEQMPTARVVIRESDFTLDFAQFRGESVNEDLRLRDLTINAIGIELASLAAQPIVRLIDPCNGVSDLRSEQLRFPSEHVVLDDPLRLLRVYRFAAQLGFTIPDETVHLISRHKNLLNQVESTKVSRQAVASERVRDELIKILDTAHAAACLRQMDENRILSQVLPEIESMRGVRQDDCHHLDLWEQSLLSLEMFEEQSAPATLASYQREIEDYLDTNLVSGLKRETVLKLALILLNIKEPAANAVGYRGEIPSDKDEDVGTKIALHIVKRLRLGGKSAKLMSCLLRHHSHFGEMLKTASCRGQANRLLKAVGKDWLGVLLVSYAELRVSREHLHTPPDESPVEQVMKEIADRYFLEILPMMARERLITGDEIMDALNLKPGPLIGEILEQVEALQFDRKIHTPEEALAAARRILETSDQGGKL